MRGESNRVWEDSMVKMGESIIFPKRKREDRDSTPLVLSHRADRTEATGLSSPGWPAHMLPDTSTGGPWS